MTIVGVHWRPDSELAAPLKAHNCHRLSMITDVVREVLRAVLADRLSKFGACPKDWPIPCRLWTNAVVFTQSRRSGEFASGAALVRNRGTCR
jgi:hypothetical protein